MNSLRISGYHPKLTTSTLLYELFCQAGPIKSITLCKRPDNHTIITFQHHESVPYCLALFEGVELHGRLLRMNPLRYNKNTNMYLNYLKEVRHKFRDEYARIDPPALPPKLCADSDQNSGKDRRSNKKRNKDRDHSSKNITPTIDKNEFKPPKRRESKDDSFMNNKSQSRPQNKKSLNMKTIKANTKRTKSAQSRINPEKKNTRRKPSQKQRRRNR